MHLHCILPCLLSLNDHVYLQCIEKLRDHKQSTFVHNQHQVPNNSIETKDLIPESYQLKKPCKKVASHLIFNFICLVEGMAEKTLRRKDSSEKGYKRTKNELVKN